MASHAVGQELRHKYHPRKDRPTSDEHEALLDWTEIKTHASAGRARVNRPQERWLGLGMSYAACKDKLLRMHDFSVPAVLVHHALANARRTAHGGMCGDACLTQTPAQQRFGFGQSFRASKEQLEDVFSTWIADLDLTAEEKCAIVLSVQNLVIWATLPEAVKYVRWLFLTSNRPTQFASSKLWLREPLGMVSIFQSSGKCLVNGCDTLVDARSALEHIAFSVFARTGGIVIPTIVDVQVYNTTCSVATGIRLDLYAIQAALEKSRFVVRFNPEQFPGLALLLPRNNKSANSNTTLSAKVFESGACTAVGGRNLEDLFRTVKSLLSLIGALVRFRKRE